MHEVLCVFYALLWLVCACGWACVIQTSVVGIVLTFHFQLILVSPVSHPPLGHQRTSFWPRQMTPVPGRNGREWPASATSIQKPANKLRMFLECDLSSSLSNKRLWFARGRASAAGERLPFKSEPHVASQFSIKFLLCSWAFKTSHRSWSSL